MIKIDVTVVFQCEKQNLKILYLKLCFRNYSDGLLSRAPDPSNI